MSGLSGGLVAQESSKSGSEGRVVVEPLLGKEFERIDVVDQRLRGAQFFLISGHGGPDPGAMSRVGDHLLCEDEYAYDVTLRLGRELMRHGAKVVFIVRDPLDGIRHEQYLRSSNDEFCYPDRVIPLNQKERLRQRVDVINSLSRSDRQLGYKRCIELHVDARDSGKNIDIFFYFQRQNRLSERLASAMRNAIELKYQQKQPGRGYNGEVSTRNLFTLRNTIIPSVFIELGNIHHPHDQQRLILENNRQALARWMCEGILIDFEGH